jgi:hypothetical protein
VYQIIHLITSEYVTKLVYLPEGMVESRRGLVLAVLIKYDKFVLPFCSKQ